MANRKRIPAATRARKKPGRTKRVIRKVTLKRARTRWKRRARKAASTYRTVRAAPGKLRLVRCSSCARRVPAGRMEGHLAAHTAQRKIARAKATKARKRAAKQQTRRQHVRQWYHNSTRNQDAARPTRPSRTEAAQAASGWVALGSGALLASPLFLGAGGSWLGFLGAGAVAAGGAAYGYQRRWGQSSSGGRVTSRASKRAARQTGCNAACMNSVKPAKTCDCPCGGTTHGSLARRTA